MSLSTTILSRKTCLVAGNWINSDSGQTLDVLNPATFEVIGAVPNCGRSETARAIDAAAQAWPAWRAMTALERSEILLRLYDLMLAEREELARLMTLEQGKPLAEASAEIGFGASFLRWFAEEGRRAYGSIIPAPWCDKRILVTREPVGVVGIITPWNFPTAMICRKAGPALAVGCPVVIKPASQTPFSALALAELAKQAGIPDGVFNVLTGSPREIGAELTGSPVVRKLSFTGSTKVGKQLLQQCATTVKKVSLELGGNAPFLVFDDADLGLAVVGALGSKYRNTGQTCVCTNRFLIQDGVYDTFLEKFTKAVDQLKVGDGLEEGVNQGPLIDEQAVLHMEAQIADAQGKGGRIITGGRRHALGGNFFEPTVIANATSEMIVSTEETFGPVAPVYRFHTEQEAVALANSTEFGLAGYVYTRDLGRAWRASEALEYGLVGVNDSLMSTCEAPFGGIKESGFGREGSHYGLDDYTTLKYICMAGLNGLE